MSTSLNYLKLNEMLVETDGSRTPSQELVQLRSENISFDLVTRPIPSFTQYSLWNK